METGYEYQKLKEKKRQLLIKINEMEVNVNKKKEMVEKLKEELNLLQAEENNIVSEESEGRLSIFMRDVCVVIAAIYGDNAFIQTKYSTASSQNYYKIHKDVFEEYISRLSSLDVKEFIDYCARLSFVKTENDKCVFSSGSARVYFLSRNVVDELKM